ncbi:MAG: carboxylating nicotinate-nucleotide diphosphorylase [Acidimicrobiales bacterium]
MSAADLRPPVGAVRDAVGRALAEDLMPLGDLTSALLPDGLTATAEFVARDSGVLAGRLCADQAFVQVDPTVVIDWSADDGDGLAAGRAFGRVSGVLASILTAERTALNFMCHLSGVATLTARYVEAAATRGDARIWDTRKTTPGLRALEKAAVRAGGGSNHRGNLSDWVLLKDNHLALFGITDAVRRARERWPARTVHVECAHLDHVKEALDAGADALLLDNMSPDEVRACVLAVADASTSRRPLLEVSGGVSLDTVADYSATGVDLISVGALTHSAPVLDIALDVRSA